MIKLAIITVASFFIFSVTHILNRFQRLRRQNDHLFLIPACSRGTLFKFPVDNKTKGL